MMTLILTVGDYVVIGLMLAISASVGIYFRFTGARQKTMQEFLMAGKNMSFWPVAFSLMATYMSAISVLGTSSETYTYGTQIIVWTLGVPIGGVVAAYVFLPVFFEMEVSTVYEYLEKRFGKPTRCIVSMLFILQMMLYTAVVLYAPSLALNAVTGFSTWSCVVTMAVVCTFYCSLGGLKAVLWTDVFQSVLMYITIISIIVKGTIDVGGLTKAMEIAKDGGRLIFFETSLDYTMRYTFFNQVASGTVFSAGTFGTNQGQIQRLMSVKTLKQAQRALLLSVPLIVIFKFFCCWDGIAIYSLFHDCDPMIQPGDTPLTSADQLVPYAVMTLFNGIPGFPGLCVAGIVSASLSTMSSAVNSLAAVTVEDFIKPYCRCKRMTDSRTTFMAKIIAIAYGGLCLFLTYVVSNYKTVHEAVNVFFGLVGGPVLGLFTVGILTKTANQEGALIGLLTGFCLNAWMGFGSYYSRIKSPQLPRSIDGCPVVANSSAAQYYEQTKANISTLQHLSINSSLFKTETMNSTVEDHYNTVEYIFPLYTVSFMWFSTIGTLTTLVVGYVASYAVELWKGEQSVEPKVLSPVVRKWILKPDHDGQNARRIKLQEMKNDSDCTTNEIPKIRTEVPQNDRTPHQETRF